MAANAGSGNRKGGADRGAALEYNVSSLLRDQNLWAGEVTTNVNRGSHMTATPALRGLVTVGVGFTGLTSSCWSSRRGGEASSLGTTGLERKGTTTGDGRWPTGDGNYAVNGFAVRSLPSPVVRRPSSIA